MTTKNERVDHPSHYNMGGPKEADGTAKYECVKIWEDWSLGVKLGNVLKYVLRAPYKGTEDEDLRKARWYLLSATKRPDPEPLRPPFHTMTCEEVVQAWRLPPDLANVVFHISNFNAKMALKHLDAYIASRQP